MVVVRRSSLLDAVGLNAVGGGNDVQGRADREEHRRLSRVSKCSGRGNRRERAASARPGRRPRAVRRAVASRGEPHIPLVPYPGVDSGKETAEEVCAKL